MFQLLIVDDEIHAVKAVYAGVAWEELNIVRIHTAYNIGQAKEIFQTYPIDMMICDIEMPQGSGIELLAWVREQYPLTESIFLTCHSSFDYAKKAVQLGSLDYMLKPVKFLELQNAVQRGLGKVADKREQLTNKETSHYYSKLWETHQPILIEKFWQDLLAYRISSSPEKIQEALHNNQLPITESDLFMPVVIAVQRWLRPLSSRDEIIMEYALRNAADYLIFNQYDGRLIRYGADNRLMVLLFPAGSGEHSYNQSAAFKQALESYMNSCAQYFNCELACYVGEPVFVYQLAEQFAGLLKLSKQNKRSTGPANGIQFLHEAVKLAGPLEQTLETVRSFIAEQVHNSISREDVARHVHLHPDYLSRLFKKETGKSVIEYILEEKMELAKRLLSDTDMSISDIAVYLGYSNFSYFARVFKNTVQMSPKQYRRQSQNNDSNRSEK